MSKVTSIGHCVGCGRYTILTDSAIMACEWCAEKGELWLRIAARIRVDPIFHRNTYERVKTTDKLEAFVALFGLPAGYAKPLEEVRPRP